MSPEQLKGAPVNLRTDIWSVGVVLYEMVTGQLPFKGDIEQSMIHSILSSDAEPISKIKKDLPKGLEQVILTCLAKSTSGRYPSMEELAADLKAILGGLKPRLADGHRLRGRILGVKKAHVLAGSCALLVLFLCSLIFINKVNPVFDSLVVLPFEDLSHDPEKAALAQDMSESLIFKFHGIGTLRVPMLSTVSVYQGSKKSARTIAREQNVKAVLYPVFERTDDTLLIRITVLDGSTELPLAAKEFPDDIANIRATEGEVVKFVAKVLGVRLTVDGGSALMAEAKVNPRAYDMYVKYKEAISAFELGPGFIKWESALPLLQGAIAIDPSYAPFYWTLVEYWRKGTGYGFIPYKDAILGADDASQRGLAIDRQSTEMHRAMGIVSLLKWNWEEARRHWQKAVDFTPGDPMAHSNLSTILQALGLFNEAITEAEKAYYIDPALQTESPIRGQALYYAGQYDAAIKAFRDALSLNSNSAWAQNMLACSYAAKGMRQETLAEAKKALSLAPPDDNILHLNVALAYAMIGNRQEAQTLLAECLAAHQGKPVDSYTVAEIYAAMGEKEKAFEWLERAYQEHSINLAQLKVDPMMANVRSDPRYKLYLRAVGLEN
jgi:tetratricopeptide (TPR) repeat protein